MIRVLFVTHVPQLGGGNRAMLQLICHLQKTKMVIPYVLLPDTDYDGPLLKDKLDEINVEYFFAPIRYFKENNPNIKYQLVCFKGYLEYLFSKRKEYKRFISYKFDIVHSNTSVIDIGAWLSLQLHAKHVWHFREFGDLDYNFYPLGTKIYERFSYRHADAYIAVSKCIANHFAKKVRSKRLFTIYDGVDTSDDAILSLHDNVHIKFISAGVLCEGKNQIEIVQAAKILRERNILEFHITLVGDNKNKYADAIRKYIKENRLENYIFLMKEVDGIGRLLSNMDVGITASKNEAFGLTTIEYQLQNLLAIVNDSGANTELVTDNQTGLVYECGNPNSLADKMEIAIKDRKRLIALAYAGRVNAMKNFTAEVNAQLVYQLYKKILL